MRLLPSMRDIFNTRTFLSAMSKKDVATLREHARFTAKMFETVIKNLDTEDKKRTDTLSEYDPVLIGRAHACLKPYGFVGTMFEKFGEIIVDVVLIQEAVRDLPGAGQAWVVLVACVIDQVRKKIKIKILFSYALVLTKIVTIVIKAVAVQSARVKIRMQIIINGHRMKLIH